MSSSVLRDSLCLGSTVGSGKLLWVRASPTGSSQGLGARRVPTQPLSALGGAGSWTLPHSPRNIGLSPPRPRGAQETPPTGAPPPGWVNPHLHDVLLCSTGVRWMQTHLGLSLPYRCFHPSSWTARCSQVSYKLLIADPNTLPASFLNKQQGLTSAIK